MGEAKRRKQLGLMPTVHPFEARMAEDGGITLTRAPEDARLREQITDALRLSQPYGPAWASEYRTNYVMAGRPDAFLETAADVEAIPVPAHRRFAGDLVLGKAGPETAGVSFPVPGGSVRLREQQHSFDGERWESFPSNADPRRALEYLMQHPAVQERGEVVATFRAEHWPEGRIDIEPDPPEELLDLLESVTREWHGDTPEDWLDSHRGLLEQGGEEPEDDLPVPVARRLVLELRRPAPLLSPLSLAFATRGNVEFHPVTAQSSYSLDGENWLNYGDGEDAEPAPDGLMAELQNFLDIATVTVTVHADGRVQWADGDIPEEHQDSLKADLTQSTGAGNAAAWAEWTTHLFTDTFAGELEVPEGETLPVPVAVKLDIPKDALGDPDPLAQTFMESEVTFNGQDWRDLYSEELPEELQPYAAGQGAN